MSLHAAPSAPTAAAAPASAGGAKWKRKRPKCLDKLSIGVHTAVNVQDETSYFQINHDTCHFYMIMLKIS